MLYRIILYKLRKVNGARPGIRIHNVNMPQITILGTTGQGLRLNQNISGRTVGEYDMSAIHEKNVYSFK